MSKRFYGLEEAVKNIRLCNGMSDSTGTLTVEFVYDSENDSVSSGINLSGNFKPSIKNNRYFPVYYVVKSTEEITAEQVRSDIQRHIDFIQ